MFGILLYTFYLVIGVLISDVVLDGKRPLVRLWVGLVTGTVLLMWSNVPFSFIYGFTVGSHLLGLACSLLITFLLFFAKSRKDTSFRAKAYIKTFQSRWSVPLEKSEKTYMLILSAFMVYSLVVLLNHTIYKLDGAMWTGQSTYGDMSMHLGFITSIATQGTFPPEYSILPGTKLNYPFLCDSVSSSLYLFGSSLRVSYIMPMLVAFVTVFTGFWFLAMRILKRTSKAVIAFMLFFLNGGFGLIYFLDNLRVDKSNFTRIFTSFYNTPTNLVNHEGSFSNIRWTNTIVDMMIPQRATLFGWMILFVVLYLLYMAVFEKKKKFFLPAGIFAGLIPMIHTHSFLACGLVAFGWMFVSLIKEKFSKEILLSWLKFGIPALLISIPQLLIWTFDAALGNESFIRHVFNWVNETDNWLWFWVKNVGVTFILLPIAFLNTSTKNKLMYSGAILIFIVGELVVFQPNLYDNNKLFLIWYLFTTIIVAELMVDMYDKLREVKGHQILAGIMIFLCVNAGVLTMARELISGFRPYSFQLYGEDHVSAADYILENTEKDATFLSYNNHNNVISSLTGRNIFCGSGSLLFFHGTGYQERENLLNSMFTDIDSFELYKAEYGIDYVFVSSYERGNYPEIIIDYFDEAYQEVYTQGEVTIYKVN
ncbi:MAG: SoxR reducing system RseC family protein [Clostridiales bacterium]|nr:SoxR reducing system RseC family protein [Clostridiales bacterium]